MNNKFALVAAVPLLALTAWTTGCKSKKSDQPKGDTDVAPVVETVDDDAVEIVRRTAERLRDAKSFQVRTEMGFDVVQSTGQKIEFGSTRRAVIQRPNRARFEFERRDGKSGVVVFDGNDIWAYSPRHEVYARTEQPETLDESIDLITEDLGISAPLADLFTEDVGKSLADGLTSCFIVGDANIKGAACSHVAVRNEYADYQMWITKGDEPTLRRIVISYREEEGQPQFWADLTEWDMSPDTNSKTFIFQPPAGAERIMFNSIRPQEGE